MTRAELRSEAGGRSWWAARRGRGGRSRRAGLARFALVVVALVALAWPSPAPARPGGGNTYRGSSSSGSRSTGSRSTGSSTGSRSTGSSTGSRASTGSSFSSSGSSRSSTSSGSSSDSWSRRPSYALPTSSSSSSDGGESSGSVGSFFFFAFVGGIILIVALVWLWNRQNGWRGPGWTSSNDEEVARQVADAQRALFAGGFGAADPDPGRRGLRPAEVVDKLRKRGAHDEDFSYALFEDFLYALYAEVHHARGGGTIERMTPYLGDKARWALMVALGTPAEVRNVVIGSMRVEAVTRPKGRSDRVA
nr:hypothetical protein [Polyangiaceae bacterium]